MQYPLYSASITAFGGTAVPYYLREDEGWALKVEDLAESLAQVVFFYFFFFFCS